jgi:hypothetical protein
MEVGPGASLVAPAENLGAKGRRAGEMQAIVWMAAFCLAVGGRAAIKKTLVMPSQNLLDIIQYGLLERFILKVTFEPHVIKGRRALKLVLLRFELL